jgi:predicted HNH restriction endonuclease
MEVYREMFPQATRVVRVGSHLRRQGLDELNDWTKQSLDFPKVTGLIIDGITKRPRDLFFESHGKASHQDHDWWKAHARKAIQHDWSIYLGTQSSTSPVFQADDMGDDERADRKLEQVSRLVRDTKCAREIKALHAHTCQLCGTQFELCPGIFYSEAHHLQPLGAPHHGPDKKGNIMCVCPSCHVRLDYHAVLIDPAKLRVRPGHDVAKRFIVHHNKLVRQR